MKIALVASTYLPRPGGLERHVDRLARGLAARGAHVEVLTQHPGRRLPGLSEIDGVMVRRFAAPIGNGHGALSPALCEHLRRTAASFDLVHVHTVHAPLVLAVVRTRPRRLVFTPHAPMQRLLRWPYTRVIGAVLHHALRTAPTSSAEADLIRRRFPRAAARVHVVPTGVDGAAILAAQPLADRGDNTVLAVGRLERHKRVDRTIAAMAGVPSGFRLAVVGAGPARHALQAHAADLRVSARVDFIGAVPDEVLYRWLRTARVVVSVAEQEASGAPVMEALSAGAPVVASDTPVHREAASLVPGAPVLFVPGETSPLRIADAICEARRMRTPSSAAGAIPSWDAVVDGTCVLYEDLLADRTRRRGSSQNGAAPQHVATNGHGASVALKG
jgi:glycosyltransferase involved in cell wall biosynthesis